jgi:hypothetical protein
VTPTLLRWLRPATGALALCMAASAVLVTDRAGAASAELPADFFRGATLTSWWHDEYASPAGDQALDELRDTGAREAALLVTWYMERRDSSSVVRDPQRTPSDSALRHAMARARALGMRVVLKPHVDVLDGTFRGEIAPASPSEWFESYRAMLLHYADLAREGGATMLIVGTELTSLSSYAQRWRGLIADVRERFPGRLTFAANQLDGAEAVTFWDALDYIGIDAYMPLSAGAANPSVEALTDAWRSRGHVERIEQLHRRYAKPVLFTEIGYQSREGTAVTPWGGATGGISHEPQQRAYEAAFRAWAEVPWFKGFLWWGWPTGGYDPADGSHDARGKPAADVMRAWFTGAATVPESFAGTTTTPAETGSSGDRRLRLALRYRGGQRPLMLRLRGAARRCRGVARVLVRRVGRAGRARHQRIRMQVRMRAARPARLGRRLRQGRYAARARVAADCGRARSRPLRFRVTSRPQRAR